MALGLNYELYTQEGCTELVFKDNTGSYTVSNTTGWGAPNDLLSSVSSVELSILLPDSSTPVVFIDAEIPELANDDFTTHVFSLEDFDLSTGSFPDGIYEVVYTVVVGADDAIYKKTLRFFVHCNVECCVQRMALQLKPNCCCDNKSVEQWLFAQSLLAALESNEAYGNETEFENILTKLEKICSYTDCGC